MKLLRLSSLALVLTGTLVVACGSDDAPTTTTDQTPGIPKPGPGDGTETEGGSGTGTETSTSAGVDPVEIPPCPEGKEGCRCDFVPGTPQGNCEAGLVCTNWSTTDSNYTDYLDSNRSHASCVRTCTGADDTSCGEGRHCTETNATNLPWVCVDKLTTPAHDCGLSRELEGAMWGTGDDNKPDKDAPIKNTLTGRMMVGCENATCVTGFGYRTDASPFEGTCMALCETNSDCKDQPHGMNFCNMSRLSTSFKPKGICSTQASKPFEACKGQQVATKSSWLFSNICIQNDSEATDEKFALCQSLSNLSLPVSEGEGLCIQFECNDSNAKCVNDHVCKAPDGGSKKYCIKDTCAKDEMKVVFESRDGTINWCAKRVKGDLYKRDETLPSSRLNDDGTAYVVYNYNLNATNRKKSNCYGKIEHFLGCPEDTECKSIGDETAVCVRSCTADAGCTTELPTCAIAHGMDGKICSKKD